MELTKDEAIQLAKDNQKRIGSKIEIDGKEYEIKHIGATLHTGNPKERQFTVMVHLRPSDASPFFDPLNKNLDFELDKLLEMLP